MSVIRPKNIQLYMAPVSICGSSISVTGSWSFVFASSEMDSQMSLENLCHYRIHSWKQTFQSQPVLVCLDFCVVRVDNTNKMHVLLKFASVVDCKDLLEEATNTVQRLIRRSKCVDIAHIFQQEQPGVGPDTC